MMKFYEIVGNILGVDPASLNEASNASNVPQWDSLRHIEVIFAVESAYQVRFTMPEIASLRNLGDMRQLLIGKNVALTEVNAERKIA
ncbi:MAG: acyl carrier protein [Hyphomicrobiaceae bacterium]